MPRRYAAQELSPQEIFATVAPSIYLVLAGRTPASISSGQGVLGSAVAIAAEWAMTNCHVVKGQPFIALVGGTKNEEVFTASIAQGDDTSDRCFLKVGGRLHAIAAVRQKNDLAIGERVYTIGNPSGLTKTFGEGLISGLREQHGVSYVQTTAPISPGSSGGALVDSKGALVGITTFLLKNTENLNFAIAAEEFWR
jgi:serine protease Do